MSEGLRQALGVLDRGWRVMSLNAFDPGYPLALAVSLLGTFFSARYLLLAERHGSRLSAWFAAGAFLVFSVSTVLDLVALFSGGS